MHGGRNETHLDHFSLKSRPYSPLAKRKTKSKIGILYIHFASPCYRQEAKKKKKEPGIGASISASQTRLPKYYITLRHKSVPKGGAFRSRMSNLIFQTSDSGIGGGAGVLGLATIPA